MAYQVSITQEARDMLSLVSDRRIQELLMRRMERLKEEPEKQGSQMFGELAGYRAVRAVGQRYRIIYRIDQPQSVVIVIGLGIRREGDNRDIYRLVERLVRLGMAEPPS